MYQRLCEVSCTSLLIPLYKYIKTVSIYIYLFLSNSCTIILLSLGNHYLSTFIIHIKLGYYNIQMQKCVVKVNQVGILYNLYSSFRSYFHYFLSMKTQDDSIATQKSMIIKKPRMVRMRPCSKDTLYNWTYKQATRVVTTSS